MVVAVVEQVGEEEVVEVAVEKQVEQAPVRFHRGLDGICQSGFPGTGSRPNTGFASLASGCQWPTFGELPANRNGKMKVNCCCCCRVPQWNTLDVTQYTYICNAIV